MTIPLIDTLSRQGGANFPIALGEDVIGAFVTVATTGARDAIPTNVLRVGAIVRISNTSSYYEWNGSAWVSVSFGGGGGGTSTGGGMGFRYTYAGSGTIGDADPGAGVFRGNNAALASVTTLFVDLLEYGGTDVTAWLDSLDDYVGAVKGVIRLSSQSDATKWIEYTVTGWTTATGYRKLTVAYKDGPGGITATVGDTFIAFDYTSISGNLAGGALTNVKSVTYGSAPVDNGNSGTADTIDWTAGDIQKSTLTGNCTYTFTDPLGVGGLTLEIIQDATGARTLVWPATVDWVGGIAPTIASAAAAVTVVSFYYNGTRYRGYASQVSGSGGSTAAGGGDGFRFTYSATTADADPGAGTMRISSASYAAAGSFTLYVDLAEYLATDVTAWLDSLTGAGVAILGRVRLQSLSDPTKWVIYNLTAWTTAAGYRKLSVTYVCGPGGLTTTAGDTFLSFDRGGGVALTGTTLALSGSSVKLRDGAAAGQELVWDGTAWQLIGRKTGTALADASVTIQFTTAAQYIWPAGTNTTSNRTITLGTTGLAAGPNAGVGAIINVFLLRASYANSIAFVNGGAGAGTLFTLPATTADPVVASFFFDGTNWSLAGWEFLGTVTAA